MNDPEHFEPSKLTGLSELKKASKISLKHQKAFFYPKGDTSMLDPADLHYRQTHKKTLELEKSKATEMFEEGHQIILSNEKKDVFFKMRKKMLLEQYHKERREF